MGLDSLQGSLRKSLNFAALSLEVCLSSGMLAAVSLLGFRGMTRIAVCSVA